MFPKKYNTYYDTYDSKRKMSHWGSRWGKSQGEEPGGRAHRVTHKIVKSDLSLKCHHAKSICPMGFIFHTYVANSSYPMYYSLFARSIICRENLELTVKSIWMLHNNVFTYCKVSSFEKKESNYTRTAR